MKTVPRAIPATLCAALVLAALSCRTPGPERPAEGPASRRLNVVVVTIDTLRADRLGCYGYKAISTPHLDRFASRGALFENAVVQTPLTAPSHASMFTGQNPPAHKVRDTGGFILNPSSTTLAEILQSRGWDTAAFVGAAVLKKGFGFERGFAVYDDRMPKPSSTVFAAESSERRAGDVVDEAIRWLNSQFGKPFFLWVHVFDPHSPYDAPSPFREKYSGRPYDGEVAYTDQELGRLLDAVGRKSPGETTLTAILSDHGESLSEHGEYTHGVFLYDSTLRIPFLIAGPGIPPGLRVKQQARSIDVLPTMLELLGIPIPGTSQGTSLVPAFGGKEFAASPSYLETLFPKINMGWTELRGIRTDRWKYIRAPKPELYDLAADPLESKNVIERYAAEARELEAHLNAAAGSAAHTPEKVRTAMVDQATLRQLRSLGYSAGSSEREFTLTGQGIDPKDRTEVLRLLYLAVSPEAGTPVSRRAELLRRALAADSGNPTVYLHLGDEYGRTGRREDALKLYQDGIRNGVRTAWLYSRLGFLYMAQGNLEQAITAYERAAQLNPADCDSLNDLGMTYLDAGRPGDAERVFQWCLATVEDHALSHNGLGLVAVRKDDFAAARGHFEKAVQMDPELLEGYLNLGRIYKMSGDYAKARQCFETFLAKASPAQYAQIIPRLREELRQMR